MAAPNPYADFECA